MEKRLNGQIAQTLHARLAKLPLDPFLSLQVRKKEQDSSKYASQRERMRRLALSLPHLVRSQPRGDPCCLGHALQPARHAHPAGGAWQCEE